MTLPLYHLDIVGGLLSIAGMWLLNRKIWWGWLFSAASGLVFIYVNATARLWGMEPVSIMVVLMGIRSAILWRKNGKSIS